MNETAEQFDPLHPEPFEATSPQGSKHSYNPLDGVGPDAPTVTLPGGGKQSLAPARLDLIDPRSLLNLGAILKDGEAKYGKDNWRSIPVESHINKAMIHLVAWLAGDRQDDHLGHALCRAMMADAVARDAEDAKRLDRKPAPFKAIEWKETDNEGDRNYRACFVNGVQKYEFSHVSDSLMSTSKHGQWNDTVFAGSFAEAVEKVKELEGVK